MMYFTIDFVVKPKEGLPYSWHNKNVVSGLEKKMHISELKYLKNVQKFTFLYMYLIMVDVILTFIKII